MIYKSCALISICTQSGSAPNVIVNILLIEIGKYHLVNYLFDIHHCYCMTSGLRLK